ncbi:spore coat protein [Salipaludibacillus neizhouensis]|uniref:Spore coat protein n=1 Tax=Salipaludibacillus neizhouensis TaxID=885475 RepID=A0A3A9KR71_9BACI|nr:spore coat protein [Salipaludibacillus neizhouensis]RKL67166.1 spore coat protein [Salipaludibacillus neizhouensis]
MQNHNEQPDEMKISENMRPQMSHGGHEIFDAQEILSGIIAMLDQYQMYAANIQDPELLEILNHQTSFMTHLYNTVLESFQTGKKPSDSTHVYNMTRSNNVVYGIQPGQPPSKPIQFTTDINDGGLSGYMLGQVKGLSSLMAMTALEMTNPVLRRVIADSVPNLIEMSYEVFLYQNKHSHYQVPQLNPQDMSQLLQSYSPAPEKPLN